MGWLSWERFRCNIDCVNDPDNCISENLYKRMADHLAADGYKDVGYQYVNIDDCWMAMERDQKTGSLVADPKRFPSGIKALADYVHGKGLKLGIYEDFGTKTCGGYPGSEYYLQKDAETFAEWGVDMLKLDGCYSNVNQMDDAYPIMGQWLNRTGRHMVYSCSWPAYQQGHQHIDYANIAKHCNLWRNYGDIADSWDSVTSIINFYGSNKENFAQVAGPGNFNDPDMLILGDYGLSYDQEKTQMAMWSIMAAPLFMSVDLRNIKPQSKALLQNKRVIAINQDMLGVQGQRVLVKGDVGIWTKPILPTNSMAVAFQCSSTSTPEKISIQLKDIGLTHSAGYNATEVFDNTQIGMFKSNSQFTATVNPSGIFFVKFTAL
ncbi:DgyrCDS7185 [Dimorphilus gyrociliatus]|uniref:Alpha-galactosidase n=1 Tax=Dimorphilus gyrociliatus TaxID=2664684 RepID=A0A7I8VQ96_9ANNE|nr:DgyrCDS7185 [Dimorphilus gyrociliatus]